MRGSLSPILAERPAKGRTVEIKLVKRPKQYGHEREQSEPAGIYENLRREEL